MEPISCQGMKGLQKQLKATDNTRVVFNPVTSAGVSWTLCANLGLPDFLQPGPLLLPWTVCLTSLFLFTTATNPAAGFVSSFLPGCRDSYFAGFLAGFSEHVFQHTVSNSLSSRKTTWCIFQIACHEEESNGEVSLFINIIFHIFIITHPYPCMFRYLKVLAVGW